MKDHIFNSINTTISNITTNTTNITTNTTNINTTTNNVNETFIDYNVNVCQPCNCKNSCISTSEYCSYKCYDCQNNDISHCKRCSDSTRINPPLCECKP